MIARAVVTAPISYIASLS